MTASPRRPLLTEIDHVAIAVHDLDAAIDYYQRAFGATVEHREVVERDGVEEALLKVAESYIQLLTPTRRRLAGRQGAREAGRGTAPRRLPSRRLRRRPGAVVAAGGMAIDEAPRPGSRGTTVAFVHPKGAFGTLIELVQE